jgi:mRNA interferase MazF
LVVSADIRNRIADDLIVVPIFSQGADGPTHVRLAKSAGGIKKDSVLFCEALTTLDREFLSRGPWGSPVASDVLDAVIRAVRRAIGETVFEP